MHEGVLDACILLKTLSWPGGRVRGYLASSFAMPPGTVSVNRGCEQHRGGNSRDELRSNVALSAAFHRCVEFAQKPAQPPR